MNFNKHHQGLREPEAGQVFACFHLTEVEDRLLHLV